MPILPIPPCIVTGPSSGMFDLQGEELSADWTLLTCADDEGPHCGWNCGNPEFHHFLELTLLCVCRQLEALMLSVTGSATLALPHLPYNPHVNRRYNSHNRSQGSMSCSLLPLATLGSEQRTHTFSLLSLVLWHLRENFDPPSSLQEHLLASSSTHPLRASTRLAGAI